MFRLTGFSAIDFNALFDLLPNPYVVVDRDLRMVGMNDAYLAVTGRTREDLTGQGIFEAFPSDPASGPGRMLRQSFAKVLASACVDHIPLIAYPIEDTSGVLTERYWSATHTPMFDDQGQVAFILQHTVDVSELHILRQAAGMNDWRIQTDLMRRANAVGDENLALGKEREYLRTLFEQAPGFMAVLREPEHIFHIANQAYFTLVGRDDLIGKTIRDALPDVEGQGFYELLDDVYRTGIVHKAVAARVLLQRQPGEPVEERFLDFVYQPIRDGAGEVNGIFVQGHDVTELRRAQETARENEERFRTLAQSLPNQVWTATPDGRMRWCNDRVYDYSGIEVFYFDTDTSSEMLHPGDSADFRTRWSSCVRTGETFETELRLRRRDGAYRWFLSRAVPVRGGGDGSIQFWVATNTDIDDQKTTESRLETLATTLGHRVEERTVELERTQEVLRQSQKMEAIGNLAGGIAHDFNNLLQVITGNLQLLGREVAGNEVAERRVNNALSGASRGAKLAAQLLAFGRRQPLAPKVLNLGRLVRDMDNLLRRSLGEAIEIDTIVGAGLWNTLVDPTNVENAVLNLAINARDAMEGHGKLTIEIGNAVLDEDYARNAFDVAPGQYVMIAVSDTGSGMPKDVLQKVFDPFFTTKPEGKGTGLGLSMVYGFVKQSEGHIRIYSEPGEGTTVRIYLPRSLDEEDMPAEGSEEVPTGGNETVLVVEDDEAVRDIAVSLLIELGYRVLKAKDADSGLAIIESGVPVDLLFTDVVMPGKLKSRELAVFAKERLPRIAVLFTSGYTENSIVHGGRLDPGVQLLSKPYTRDALARKVRHVLEQSRSLPPSQITLPGTSPVAMTDEAPASTRPIRTLLVEDEALIRFSTGDYLQEIGMEVLDAGSAGEALAVAAGQNLDILVTDVNLPDMSGLQLALELRERLPGLPVIFATGDRNVPGAEDLAGTALLTKPYDYDLLAARIRSMVGSR
ncbi:response regulator [Neorhizobium lilium]|uniref:histidine kinase n=1 Tax=Neorhizobium lilium TaxID=2503024 RepID=A0A3S4UQ43_9HYPH|nr:PAS domain-containing protein [Neorhizobium lilium]RWX78529.1 response regulator [Neorhizobium lilium]